MTRHIVSWNLLYQIVISRNAKTNCGTFLEVASVWAGPGRVTRAEKLCGGLKNVCSNCFHLVYFVLSSSSSWPPQLLVSGCSFLGTVPGRCHVTNMHRRPRNNPPLISAAEALEQFKTSMLLHVQCLSSTGGQKVRKNSFMVRSGGNHCNNRSQFKSAI